MNRLSVVEHAMESSIEAVKLKGLIDSQTDFVLLDARGPHWHDGNKIPGAILAWYEDSADVFEKIIPAKNLLIVVYCFSSTCPLGPRLAGRLVQLGYENVIQYPGGLKEWRDIDHYPVEIIQQ